MNKHFIIYAIIVKFAEWLHSVNNSLCAVVESYDSNIALQNGNLIFYGQYLK